MTERKQALQDLRDKVAAGDIYGPNGFDKEAFHYAFSKTPDGTNQMVRAIYAFHGDFNAALWVHKMAASEWQVQSIGEDRDGKWSVRLDLPPLGDKDGNIIRHTKSAYSFGQPDPARALLLAFLSALIAKEETP